MSFRVTQTALRAGLARALGLAFALAVGFAPGDASTQGGGPSAGVDPDEPAEAYYRIERGDELAVLVPRHEELVFGVRLGLGFLGAPTLGTVTLSIDVEPFQASPLLLQAGEDGAGELGEWVHLQALAEGSYQVYTLHDLTETLILPQAWPRIIHRKTQTGTENRRRELLAGLKDGVPSVSARKDHHCKGCESRAHYLKPGWVWQKEHHCEDCDRPWHSVWRPYKEREVPPGSVDMLTAVQLARTMVIEGVDELSFYLIDNMDVWHVGLRRGETRQHKIRAGTFDAVEIELKTRRADVDEEEKFVGLFGMHGTIHMWFDAEQGFPVLIEGKVPLGPIKFSVSVELQTIRR